ncbi:hypothetical protein [Paenibacillus sp. HB172176]|uniref:hypothetical protein n=1 Tax=Paenibacillus sp. HB172176 TaxID=2493690 RepID=UPI001F0E1DE3|nr:hypothetical protein [Paenibacillus sp. HB172176]
MSKMFDEIKNGFLQFANRYAKAVQSGAEVAGEHVVDSLEELDRAADIPAGKLFEAVKAGALHAVEQMVISGEEFVAQMKKNQNE